MTRTYHSMKLALVPIAALSLSACVTPYTGPVEVTRFVAEDTSALGTGSISVAIRTGEDDGAERLDTTYRDAIMRELERLGYSASAAGEPDQQALANITTTPIETVQGRSGTSVGVGGSTGSFGGGVGLGIGFSLGGKNKNREVTQMEVRITSQNTGETLWEGRAEIVTSTDSAYNPPAENARALAAALFRDFPGGNGETVQLTVDELERTP
ncbi:DUF4136 domain-containing protein [Erythrobacter crassostreae]|uniref:DUF4136 domain-containing protein n=1 Tax=Erythrobacter crassostreae TaxID=2828328 RepID=A0A9X1F0T3_9SPHN|nr:DUF4136 domain-containing protein [Erythrobacter crassostrea]MBV7258241.1 DUF4136 domain-containing protein [Erythrobacter crassostrea]